ncbi:C40 family peptidase [Lachnoanaerobaculum umeaense]|uniref:Hydrolase n=1 Tax=Lachnoanaerobaculum umeaense TaxID=617123 RepID=A0A385Q0K8_9FIRM|nr:NlpC/P60 family protein [Lachnoanaerobaculum umeaense]AYA99792.1 hydrolase [Lachnoanaerobaculum umeaense]
MKKKILTLASTLTFVSLYSFSAYADMDLETNNAVSGIAVALNNYKASSISPQTALGESLKTATTNTIEITGIDDARTRLVNDTVKYEAPSVQDKLKEEILKEDIVVANNKKDTVVHASAKETGAVVGSISYSSVATVVDSEVNETGEWLKINSGSVEGYVKASEVATGEKAKKLAKDAIVTYATVVDIDNVRLRTSPEITTETLTMLKGGGKYVVVGQDNDFVKVQVDDDLTGYIYKDFVKADLSYKTAKTTEESTIEALEKKKLETEAEEAMAIYKNMVVADDKKDMQKSKVVEESTSTKNTQKPTSGSEEPKTIKSPAAETRETPASKEVDIKVPDTTTGTSKAKEEKKETPKETKTKETSKPTEATDKIDVNSETVEPIKDTQAKKEPETIKAIEDTETAKVTVETVKAPESTKAAETVKAPESTKAAETVKAPESTKAAETVKAPESTKAAETVKAPESTKAAETVKAPESTKAAETVKAPESTKAAETVKALESTKAAETVKAPESTKAAETVKEPESTKAAETVKEPTEGSTQDKPVEISIGDAPTAPYGPGGSSEKPKETEAPTKQAQKESSSVTGENGGPGVTMKAETTVATTAATKAAKEKVSRTALVAYAKQFVGNPYVFGGTSLTNGADCSGFVMRVYEKFDISTGRNTKQQANNSREISIDAVQPGDLIFYGSGGEISHVAIYMGDGRVVHAANSKSGIITSSMTYRTPIKAVTFIK